MKRRGCPTGDGGFFAPRGESSAERGPHGHLSPFSKRAAAADHPSRGRRSGRVPAGAAPRGGGPPLSGTPIRSARARGLRERPPDPLPPPGLSARRASLAGKRLHGRSSCRAAPVLRAGGKLSASGVQKDRRTKRRAARRPLRFPPRTKAKRSGSGARTGSFGAGGAATPRLLCPRLAPGARGRARAGRGGAEPSGAAGSPISGAEQQVGEAQQAGPGREGTAAPPSPSRKPEEAPALPSSESGREGDKRGRARRLLAAPGRLGL